MFIAGNGSGQGNTSGINRRQFLGLTVLAAGVAVTGCVSQTRPVLVQQVQPEVDDTNQTSAEAANNSGLEVVAEKAKAEYKPLQEMEDMFSYDIMHYNETANVVGAQTSVLAENATYVRQAYASCQFRGKEEKRLGLLAFRYTNLVACSLARDLPSVPQRNELEDIVRLEIAETITSNSNARKLLESKRKTYEKQYRKVVGNIDIFRLEEYKKLRRGILEQYRLTKAYEDATDFGKGFVRFAGQFVDHVEPFDDILYGLEHTSLPPTPVQEREMVEGNKGTASKHVNDMVQLYTELRAEHESSLVDFLEGSPIGNVEKAENKSRPGQASYHFKLDVSVLEEEVTNYNSFLAGAYLAYGQKMNTLINLAMGDKKTYSKDERARLAISGSRLKTGLAWQEKQEAKQAYAKFEQNSTQKDLARAASHALAAYVLASDPYDQAVFKGMIDDYKEKMSQIKVSKEARREANVEVLFPYYLDELNGRKRKAFLTGIWGAARTALIGYSIASGAAGGAGGGSGGAAGFSAAGGFI